MFLWILLWLFAMVIIASTTVFLIKRQLVNENFTNPSPPPPPILPTDIIQIVHEPNKQFDLDGYYLTKNDTTIITVGGKWTMTETLLFLMVNSPESKQNTKIDVNIGGQGGGDYTLKYDNGSEYVYNNGNQKLIIDNFKDELSVVILQDAKAQPTIQFKRGDNVVASLVPKNNIYQLITTDQNVINYLGGLLLVLVVILQKKKDIEISLDSPDVFPPEK